jgi:hypothetical protein
VKPSIIADRKCAGFTLVELIITMAVFMVVIAIAAQTFDNILSNSIRYSKSEESNIEGVIGLEVLRHDLEQMGFGLPWLFKTSSTISYNESVDTRGKEFNDATTGVPRAFAGREGFGEYGSDFFAVKASTVGVSKPSQRWTYIPFHNFSTATGRESRPVAYPSLNLQTNDKVIAVRSNFNIESEDHVLIDSSGSFSFAYDTAGGIAAGFLPVTDQETHLIYGIANAGETPRMPFNRADYFVNYSSLGTPRPPSFCAEKTGVLYKATIKHSDGTYSYMPLLDCVADMQVVLGWDTSEKGRANSVDAYSSMPAADGTVTASGPAGAASMIKDWLVGVSGDPPGQIPRNIREHLKVIKVYILAQEGRRDRNYTSPTTTFVVGKDCRSADANDIDCGLSLTRQYTLSAEQQHFRWKLYRLVVRPKNLVSNQR